MRVGVFMIAVALGFAPAIHAQKNSPQKLVILLLGSPGSGKTTQAKKMTSRYRVSAYSMSDILNKEAGWVKTRFKKDMKAMIASGDFITDEIANQLIGKYITQKKAQRGFILDGYPVTPKQAEYLAEQLNDLGLPQPIVIHLQVPDAIAAQRMNRRRRADDTPENIGRRLAEYRQAERFVLGFYNGRLKSVDGTKSEEEVWRQVSAAVDALRTDVPKGAK